MERELFIRDADPEDAKKLVEIYSYYVLNTAVSFEYEAPSVEEFKNRIKTTKEKSIVRGVKIYDTQRKSDEDIL